MSTRGPGGGVGACARSRGGLLAGAMAAGAICPDRGDWRVAALPLPAADPASMPSGAACHGCGLHVT